MTQRPGPPENPGRFTARTGSDYVIWIEESYDNAEIYVHRISTSETWNLTDHPDGQFWPRMDGTRVVWTDLRHGGGSYSKVITYDHADISMYDFATDELREITKTPWACERSDRFPG